MLEERGEMKASGNIMMRHTKKKKMEVEKERLLLIIEKGLKEIEGELNDFKQKYSLFLENGSEIEERFASWKKLFDMHHNRQEKNTT
jgi:hypothetical protein